MLAGGRQLLASGAMLALLLAAAATAFGSAGSADARPEAGAARICGSTTWRHGVADIQHLRGIACARAKTVVRYALNRGVARPGRPGFLTSPRRFMGFRFVFQRGTYDTLIARDGRANITFALCWFNVDC